MATSGARAPGAGTGGGLPGLAGPDGEAARPGGERRMPVLLGVFSARTWLALISLLAGAVISTLAFLVVVTGVSVGVSLLPVFLAGLPVLLTVVWLSEWFARVERARFALLTGTQIPGPPPRPPAGSIWRGLWRYFTTASTWRFFAYVVFVWPLQLAAAIVLTALWGIAAALLALPAYNHALPGGHAHLGSFALNSPAWVALSVATGVVLLLGASPLTQAAAAGEAVLASWLLGPGRAGRARLAARIGELETSRAGVVDAAETERRRIERDLHDGAQQRLVSLAMELGRARAKFASDPAAAEALVGQAHEQAKAALTELRNLVRGVHPPVLSDRGLDAALSGLAALSPVPVTVRVDLPERPPAAAEAIAYFVVAEALTNVAKHAKASRALVTATRTGDLLTVAVRDDGTGGADPSGRGLSGLAARVAAVDGRLLVTSPAGGPTVIEAVLPCG